MEEKDRWNVHLEYLKLAIALATALIGAAATIYVDETKVPTDISRYFLLGAFGAFFLMLVSSVLSLSQLCNYFLHVPRSKPPSAGETVPAGGQALAGTAAAAAATVTSPLPTPAPAPTGSGGAPQTAGTGSPGGGVPAPPPADATGNVQRGRSVVNWANVSFSTLILGSFLLGLFFLARTLSVKGSAFERATANGDTASKKLLDSTKHESANLRSVIVQGNKFELTYQVTPGTNSITITTDASGGSIETAKRQ